MSFKVHRYHDICAGHRVVGHEGKCQHLHGHNYRVHFTCIADPAITAKRSKELGIPQNSIGLDEIGRVIDFSVIKERLCMWLETNWDHKFLAWVEDWFLIEVFDCVNDSEDDNSKDASHLLGESIVWVPFNPTAEHMAKYLVEVVGPRNLEGTGVMLGEVTIEETAKCHVTYGVQNG